MPSDKQNKVENGESSKSTMNKKKTGQKKVHRAVLDGNTTLLFLEKDVFLQLTARGPGANAQLLGLTKLNTESHGERR
jgi:hypothetical protein